MRSLKALVVIALLLVVSLALSYSAVRDTIPFMPSLETFKLDGYPTESIYSKALKVTDLRFQGNGEPAKLKTVFYLFSAPDGLHWAGVCYQHRVQASQVTNNEPMYSDDHVVLMLDPYSNGQGKLIFRVNPLGTHHSSSSWSRNWRPIWYSKARVLKENGRVVGWSFEAVIPFDVLGLKEGERRVGVNLLRYVASSGALYAMIWSSNYSDPSTFAHYTLKVKASKAKLIFMPQLYTYFDLEGESPTLIGLGADVYYKPGDYTVAITLNPSFWENSIRERYITPTAGERYLKETRPFFREGIYYLAPFDVSATNNLQVNPYFKLFYTRRLSSIDAGLKVFGRFGDLEGGLLAYRVPGGDVGYAARMLYSQRFGGAQWKYAAFVSKGTDDALPTTWALEVKRVDNESTGFIQYSCSGGEHALLSEYLFDNNKGFLYDVSYISVSPNFSTPLGYVPMRGINFFDLATMFYKVSEGKRYVTDISFIVNYSYTSTSVVNDYSYYLRPFKRREWDLMLKYSVGKFEFNLFRAMPEHVDIMGEHIRSDFWFAKLSYDATSNDYIGINAIKGWFFGDRYDMLYLRAGKSITKNLSFRMSGYWVELAGRELRDVTYELSYKEKDYLFSLGISYDERGDSNLVFKYQRYMADGSEIHVLYGDPSALTTRNTLYVKYIKRFEFEI